MSGRILESSMIKFKKDNHIYESLDQANPVDWISVTGLVAAFKQSFDPVAQSKKSSVNSRSKWFAIPPEEIQRVWKQESQRSNVLGDWYHGEQEKQVCANDKLEGLQVIKPIYIGDDKLAPTQTLIEGVYPEHFVLLSSMGLCGQSDRVTVKDKRVNILDHKTNKIVKTQGYTNWEGAVQRMVHPLSHLDDCELVHYSLQLSIYLYMILKHNPQLSPGTLTIEHVLFKQKGTNDYGYPIYKTNDEGGYIIDEIKNYTVPYMKTEVLALMTYLKDNREIVKQKIQEAKNK